MIGAGVVLAIVVGLLRGGKLERLGELRLEALPLVWAAIILRVAAGVLAERGFLFAPWLQVVAYMMLIYMVFLNSWQPGLKIFGLGSLSNFLVIAVNGGTMPVSMEAVAKIGMTEVPSGIHSVLTAGTRLWFLADIIPVTFRFPRPTIISVGDILIVVGMFIFIQRLMMRVKKARYLF